MEVDDSVNYELQDYELRDCVHQTSLPLSFNDFKHNLTHFQTY
jgi:hypothetical protein